MDETLWMHHNNRTYKVRMGNLAAWAQLSKVPSLLVMKTGHFRCNARAAFWKPVTVFFAYLRREALRMEAFSRSKRPIWATSLEHTMLRCGSFACTIEATRSSCLRLISIGAKTEMIATAWMPCECRFTFRTMPITAS